MLLEIFKFLWIIVFILNHKKNVIKRIPFLIFLLILIILLMILIFDYFLAGLSDNTFLEDLTYHEIYDLFICACVIDNAIYYTQGKRKAKKEKIENKEWNLLCNII